MREKLNGNPVLQVAVIGVLLVGAGFFFLSMGGEEEEGGGEAGTTEATATAAGGATPGEAVEGAVEAASPQAGAATPVPADVPPPPWSTLLADLRTAVRSDRPVAILLVRGGNELEDYTDRASARIACCVNPNSRNFRIDDQLLHAALRRLNVQLFVAGAQQVSHFAAITTPLGVDRVPALIVLKPDSPNDGGLVQGTVKYGHLTPENIVQAVIDAGYKGRTLDYHP